MVQKRLFILGVPLDVFTQLELRQRLLAILRNRRQRQIVTPNPEFLLLAQRHPQFLSVLREATLAIPDGFGLKIAAWFKGKHIQRFPGADVVTSLLRYGNQHAYKVLILNRRDGLSTDEEILTTVSARYPQLTLYIEAVDKDKPSVSLERIKSFQPDLLFSSLGAPQQDILVARILKKVPSLRLGMGVGGSFDFLTGKQPRAPRLFRQFGFEWLWRLIIQPRRVKRIWRAVVVFLFEVLRWELRAWRFRPNVVAFIINQNHEVLILNSRGHGNYWGLPQGGQEKGESIEEALRREVFEETALQDLTLKASFKNIYQYTWNKPYTHSGYKGQRQSLGILYFNGPRQAVRTNPFEHKAYQWVKIEDLIRKTSPVHKKQYELFLKKYYEFKHQS